MRCNLCTNRNSKENSNTLAMQSAAGPSKWMTGILIGTEMVDQYDISYLLVISGVSVFGPLKDERNNISNILANSKT